MEKCLITGATGLIGKHVAHNLKDDYEIHAITRRRSSVELSEYNSIEMDLSEEIDTQSLPSQMDYIIHLAQSEHHRFFPEYARELFSVNTRSTAELLEYARKANVKNFILVSSGGIYGNGARSFSEAEKLELEHRGYYLGTKLCSEILAKAYEEFFNVIILRPFFVYGKNQRIEMLIPRLINSIKSGLPIILETENGILINPTHAYDAAMAISKAVHLKESRTINIGGPEILSLREICDNIASELNCIPQYHVKESTEKMCIGEIDEMQKWLWKPNILFKEGIKLMLEE